MGLWTVVIAQGRLWWETETMEVESGSHKGQTGLLSAHSTSTRAQAVTTKLSLALLLTRRSEEHTYEREEPNQGSDAVLALQKKTQKGQQH